jgi:starvation-inducible DNA-binding protein
MKIKSHNDMPEKSRKAVIDLLNARLADAVDLLSQAKQAHWNVKGPSFIGLHELFDKVYDAVEEAVDEIAERCVALGGVAMGTVRMSAKASKLKEYPSTLLAGTDHVKALALALSSFARLSREAIEQAEKQDDAGTADMFTDIVRSMDKMMWFVEAHVQADH